MAVSFEITMQARNQLGTNPSRRLRRAGKVPVVLYRGKEPTVLLAVEHSLLERLMENDAFYSSILIINVEEVTYRAILKNIKRDPVKPKILDIELLNIQQDKPIHLSVPLHIIGEQSAPGIKQSGGIVSIQLTTIGLRCLPKDIPESITVDISNLGVSEPIMLSQLQLPKGVSLAKADDRVVVTILLPRGQSGTATAEADKTGNT